MQARKHSLVVYAGTNPRGWKFEYEIAVDVAPGEYLGWQQRYDAAGYRYSCERPTAKPHYISQYSAVVAAGEAVQERRAEYMVLRTTLAEVCSERYGADVRFTRITLRQPCQPP